MDYLPSEKKMKFGLIGLIDSLENYTCLPFMKTDDFDYTINRLSDIINDMVKYNHCSDVVKYKYLLNTIQVGQKSHREHCKDKFGFDIYNSEFQKNDKNIDKETKTYIYFIQENNKGFIKIGYTKNIHKRLKQHQTSNSSQLTILGTMEGDAKIEKMIHKMFENAKYKNEWFYPVIGIFTFIQLYCSKILESK